MATARPAKVVLHDSSRYIVKERVVRVAQHGSPHLRVPLVVLVPRPRLAIRDSPGRYGDENGNAADGFLPGESIGSGQTESVYQY
jgi:hypothetical protein